MATAVLCAAVGATLLALLLVIGISLAIAAASKKSNGKSKGRGAPSGLKCSAAAKTSFTQSDARNVAKTLGVDWNRVEFTADDLRRGMNVELEHGCANAQTNVTSDDPVQTAQIALAHLRESPRYYDLLEEMERRF